MTSKFVSFSSFNSPKKDLIYKGLLFTIFLIILGIDCLIHYSDGDDAIFLQTVSEYKFFDFLKMRYISWSGRLAADAAAYILFSLPLFVWRVFNAVAICSIIHLLIQSLLKKVNPLISILIAATALVLLDFHVTGWACFWITGSIFYLWPAAAAIFAIYTLYTILKTDNASKLQKTASFLFLIYAALSQEQTAGALFMLESSFFLLFPKKWKRILPYFIITLFCIAIILLAPGTAIRSQNEVASWFPVWNDLTLKTRSILSIQWLLNGFAESMPLLFASIQSCILVYIISKKNRSIKFFIPFITLVILIIGEILSFAKISLLTNFGFTIENMTTAIVNEKQLKSLSIIHIIPVLFQSILLLSTFILIFIHSRRISIFFITGFACAAVLIFSPTMYASAGRVFFIPAILFAVISLHFFSKIQSLKSQVLLTIWISLLMGMQLVFNYKAALAYVTGT